LATFRAARSYNSQRSIYDGKRCNTKILGQTSSKALEALTIANKAIFSSLKENTSPEGHPQQIPLSNLPPPHLKRLPQCAQHDRNTRRRWRKYNLSHIAHLLHTNTGNFLMISVSPTSPKVKYKNTQPPSTTLLYVLNERRRSSLQPFVVKGDCDAIFVGEGDFLETHGVF
jgi:hypothetical protein